MIKFTHKNDFSVVKTGSQSKKILFSILGTKENHNIQRMPLNISLAIDISGSMNGRYNDGTVQAIIDKTVPMAVQFDDDGEFDCWYYQKRRKAPGFIHGDISRARRICVSN